MPAALRVNSGTPRWVSSWAMLRLAEGWVRLNSRAAALQLPDRATDSKIRRLRREGTSRASATIRLPYSPFAGKGSHETPARIVPRLGLPAPLGGPYAERMACLGIAAVIFPAPPRSWHALSTAYDGAAKGRNRSRQ